MDARKTRVIDRAGRPVLIRADDEIARPYRGFFSGDDFVPHHVQPSDADTNAPRNDVTIEYEGQAYDLHRTSDGGLRSHLLPTLSFTSVDEAASMVAGLVDLGVLRGRSP